MFKKVKERVKGLIILALYTSSKKEINKKIKQV